MKRKHTCRGSLCVACGCAMVLFIALGRGAGAETSGPAKPLRLDPTIATTEPAGKWLWYDARNLDVEGRGWNDTEQFYHRFPARAKGVVRDGVWDLSMHTAGMAVRFVTDADSIAARWTVTSKNLAMDHMPATGVSGVDLYVKDGKRWRWIGVGRPTAQTNEATLASGIPKGEHEYMLYLPLYNGTESLAIGVPPKASLCKAPPRPAERARPIVYYGTSIAQGGCANRPGMAHTSILGRMLDWHVINLGFSGNGTMDMPIEQLMAELDAAMYVVDCVPNMNPQTIAERTAPFVTALRKARPDTPIVLVENIVYQSAYFLPHSREGYESKNRAQRKAYEDLLAQGTTRLYYVPCDTLLGTDGEATVDGVHATDLGFQRFAEALAPALRGILLGTTGGAAASVDSPLTIANPQAVEEVKAGKRTVASAAWWGFDPQDSTRFLQAAIDSGAPKVIVPYMGKEWIVTPVKLRGNLELVFEPGVLVLAKKGAFKGRGESLFTAQNAADLTIRGYGATLRMHKRDYQNPPYSKAEWRMTLDVSGCRRVRIEGLRLEGSGGDGIYLGATGKQPYCEDVVIRDVVCHDHHRQGISVISAVNLLIENCTLSNTGGTAPQAGIDFEPNSEREKLVHCVMRNCIIEGNAGAGVLVYTKPLSSQSDPISIRVEGCHIRSGRDVGIGVGAVLDNGPLGLIEFVNCTIENTAKGGIYVYDKSADRARVRFVNCSWSNVGKPDASMLKTATGKAIQRHASPLLIHGRRPKLTGRNGGIDFVDCHVYDDLDRSTLVIEDGGSGLGVHDIRGNITVHNPHGGKMDLKCKASGVDVRLTQAGK